MSLGLVGRKLGMTRVFTPEGKSLAVTVLEVLPNRCTQLKTLEKDGYSAIQVTTGVKKRSRLNKPEAGHFARNNIEPGLSLNEFRATPEALDGITVGSELTVSFFDEIKVVDVTSVSKGKGFAGCVKRHNFSTQDATHGNSLSHRAPGSTGQNQTPRRVFKGKKMAGQMGNHQVTVQNLSVVRVDAEKQVLLVLGSVPGAPGGEVVIKPAVKAAENASSAA